MIGRYLKLAFLILLLNCLTLPEVFSQKLNFKSKIEFFSYPFTEFSAEEITDIQVDQDGFVWIISFSNIYKYDGSNFLLINTKAVNHGSFLRFHESKEGKKYITDFDGAVFFIERDKIFPFSENALLQDLNFKNKFLDIQYENEEFLLSYETKGVKHLVDSIYTNYIPNNRETNYRGYGCSILKDSSILITSLSFNKRSSESNYPAYFFINDSEFNVIDSILVENYRRGGVPNCIKLPNGNYLFSDGKYNLIEFNSKVRVLPHGLLTL